MPSAQSPHRSPAVDALIDYFALVDPFRLQQLGAQKRRWWNWLLADPEANSRAVQELTRISNLAKEQGIPNAMIEAAQIGLSPEAKLTKGELEVFFFGLLLQEENQKDDPRFGAQTVAELADKFQLTILAADEWSQMHPEAPPLRTIGPMDLPVFLWVARKFSPNMPAIDPRLFELISQQGQNLNLEQVTDLAHAVRQLVDLRAAGRTVDADLITGVFKQYFRLDQNCLAIVADYAEMNGRQSNTIKSD